MLINSVMAADINLLTWSQMEKLHLNTFSFFYSRKVSDLWCKTFILMIPCLCVALEGEMLYNTCCKSNMCLCVRSRRWERSGGFLAPAAEAGGLWTECPASTCRGRSTLSPSWPEACSYRQRAWEGINKQFVEDLFKLVHSENQNTTVW